MAFLAVEGPRSIYYEHYPVETAAIDAVTVVLVHGWGLNCRAWDMTLARLRHEGFGVVRYDQRGCGRSDMDFQDLSIGALAADLVALCAHLALRHPVLNGWSLGGAQVIAAAATMLTEETGLPAPLRPAGLILTSGATPRHVQGEGFPYGGSTADLEATIAALRTDRVNVLRGLYHEGVFARDPGTAVKDWCWQMALEASPVADASLGALGVLDQRDLLPRIDVPTLVIAGSLDAVVPAAISRYAAELLPDAEYIELPGVGHAPFLEAPDAYHEGADTFLKRLQQDES